MTRVVRGYRRRILIEPAAGQVVAELEDDYHRMLVRLHHADDFVVRVESEMRRAPWTLCPGAMRELERSFARQPLATLARVGAKSRNCTHLHDLALFAAAHARDLAPTAYDVLVTDPVADCHEARLARNGVSLLIWTFANGRIVAPPELAGRGLGELGDWIDAQDAPGREAGRILRWAAILAQGRGMAIPDGIAATIFPLGTCFNFQPENAVASTRLPGADHDLSLPGREPLVDRAAAFATDGTASVRRQP